MWIVKFVFGEESFDKSLPIVLVEVDLKILAFWFKHIH